MQQTWKTATLSRDLSARKQYETDLMMPEFGAGSEFGRRQKLEVSIFLIVLHKQNKILL